MELAFDIREIRNAVVSACVSVAMRNGEVVCQEDFVKACDKISKERKELEKAKDYTQKTNPAEDFVKQAILNKINDKEMKTDVSK